MSLEEAQSEKIPGESKQKSCLRGDIAIIGMGCIFPGANDLQTFWQNIVLKVDAVTEVKPERWDPVRFYDEDPDVENKVYCKRGGYIDDLATFNPLNYGVMPLIIEGGEPDQFLAIRVAYDALADAGYLDKTSQRSERLIPESERTRVIIGRGNYIGHGNCNATGHSSGIEQVMSILRKLHPEYSQDELEEIRQALLASLPKFNHENAPAIIPNMTTGRIANRLGFMGPNYTLDAACASTLIAAEIGVRDLLTNICDVAMVGGIHVCMLVPLLSVFCEMKALSLSSQIRPFDKKADGLIPGEGLGFMILKRLEDAERDGNRIYAVIKGIGTSSDGRGSSVTAPRVEGEELSLRRAYEMVGIDPGSVGLIEGHGTATTVGDAAELGALVRVFGERDDGFPPKCALGSVKSMIGHAMPAAGAAGMIKAALALYHKILPPTIHCDEPSSRVDWSKSAFYINTETRPWIHGESTPRRAVVNAFGFGGVNAHVILEEYRGAKEESASLWHKCDSEVIILQSESRQELMKQIQQLKQYLMDLPTVPLKDLAYTLNAQLGDLPYRLSIVATSVEDLHEKLEYSLKRLSDPSCKRIKYVNGVFFFEEPLARKGKLAFLFPGEGSQYVNMLADLCMHFPEVRQVFDRFDRASISRGNLYLPSQIIFPPPVFSDEQRKIAEDRIWEMDAAIQGVLAANGAINLLLRSLGIQPDMIAGHSTGELAAMFASGMVTLDDRHVQSLADLHHLYKNAIESSDIPQAVMVAVGAGYDTVSDIASEIDGDIYVAMDNCPHQVVAVSDQENGEKFLEILRKRGIIHEKLPFDRAYHTPLFEAVCDELLDHFGEWDIKASDISVYSCVTTKPFPKDPEAILRLTVEHWMRPVQFRRTIEAMYEAGARIFVEVGPQAHLTGFIDDILRDREYLAMPANIQRRSGITQLSYLIGILAAHGVSMRLEPLYKRRSPLMLSLEASEDQAFLEKSSITGTVKLDLSLPEATIDEYLREKAATRKQAGKRESEGSSGARIQHPSSPQPSITEVMSGKAGYVFPSTIPDDADSVISQYMQMMENFLEVQEEVMHSYMHPGGGIVNQQTGEDIVGFVPDSYWSLEEPDVRHPASSTEFPYIETILSYKPGEELIALREVSLDEDIFLYDHTFGGEISVDKNLIGLPVIPMTVSMEMMAEAAALLQPGKVLMGMKQIRANQWIKLEGEPVTIHFFAQALPESLNEVLVQIRDLEGHEEADPSELTPVIEGVMVFGDIYPEPPAVGDFAIKDRASCKKTARQVYEGYHLFHGPRFQNIVSLDGSSFHAIEATLEVFEMSNLFRSNDAPNLLTDQSLLDAVGQVFGYWAYEQLEVGYIVFPIRVESLHIYGPNKLPGERVKCRVNIHRVTSTRIHMDADVIGADGKLWIRILGWSDWRFYLPDESYDFWRFPSKTVLSKSADKLVSIVCSEGGFEDQQPFECYFIRRLSGQLGQEIWMSNWVHQILSSQERWNYLNSSEPKEKKHEWLFGRMAVKDAVRVFIKNRYGMELYPADIDVTNDEYERYILRGYWTDSIDFVPAVSLSYSHDLAVAITGESDFLGIDIKKIEEQDQRFEESIFTEEEQELLAGISSQTQRWEMLTQLWCAKEAVANALGRGFVESPSDLVISDYKKAQKFGVEYGILEVNLCGRLLDEFPEYASRKIVVYTTRYEEYAIAITVRG